MAITRATAAAAAAACFLGTLTPPTAGLQGDWRPGLHLSRTKTALQECPFNLAACAFMDLPDAPQYVYQRGVPHTDRHGNRRTVYSEEESFLPQGLYHALYGKPAPINCENPKRDCNFSLDFVKDAGFNTVHFWEGVHLDQGLIGAAEQDLQVIFHMQNNVTALGPHDNQTTVGYLEAVRRFANHTNMLGWYLDEEPTGAYYRSIEDQSLAVEKFAVFLERKAAIQQIDPVHPVFVLDCQWYTGPGDECSATTGSLGPGHAPSPHPAADTCIGEWWQRWNTAGDVSMHDNYPFPSGQPFYPASSTLGAPTTWGANPVTVSMAAYANNESKPVWLVVQAHEILLLSPLAGKMPDPRQLRAQVYAGLIHGATGIVYYAFDSWIMRNSNEVGIAPNTTFSDGNDYAGKQWPSNSSTSLNKMSVTAWETAADINRQMGQLRHVILSPTAGTAYTVGLAVKPGAPSVRCAWHRDGIVEQLGGDPRLVCPTANVSTTPIRTMLKGPITDASTGTKYYYLLAINLDGTPLGAQFSFAEGPGAPPAAATPTVETMWEGGRELAVEVGTYNFVDSFEAYGVHVYRWRTP